MTRCLALACLVLLAPAALAAPASGSAELPMKAASAAPSATSSGSEAASATPDGRGLLRAFMEASGGQGALAEIQNAVVRSSISIPAQSMQGSMTIAFARPDKILSSGTIEGIGRIEQGWDGTIGWSIDPMTGARLLSPGELKQLQNSESNVFNLQSLDTLYEKAETKGMATFAGVQAWEVLLVSDGRESLAYFDPATKLMIGMKTKVASAIGEVPAEITLSDYRAFGKLKLPSKSSQVLLGGVIEARSTIDSVEFNVPADKLPSFVPPPEVAALTSAEAPAGE